MEQNGVVRFPGNLDPSAQEFRPAYHFPFLSPPPHHPFYPPEIIFPPLPPPNYAPTPPPEILPPAPVILPPSLPPPASSPTRALLLSAVPPEVSESGVRRELEVFGDVRAVQMERVREGIVTVHFYDLRAAHAALEAVRDQHMQHQNRLRLHFTSLVARGSHPLAAATTPPLPPPGPGIIAGRAVWAQFTVPATNAFPDGLNQGTLVIFNLDPSVSTITLKDIFQPFGVVKELRETPMKRQQRFVEFYDVRDASKALTEMNGKEINGRPVMIEFSRPGGHSNKKHHHHHQNFHPPSPPPPPPPPVQPRPFFRHRRTSPRQQQQQRRRSSPSSEESTEVRMSRLTLRGGADVEERENASRKKNCGSSSKQQQQQGKGGRPWKGRQKNFDPRYLIKEEAIMVDDNNGGGCKDLRTTVMIKNIPNKYSQKLLLNMLDNHCIHCNEQISSGGDEQPLSSYDFVYLPIDFNNKCNVGYGFVNMTSPEATLRLYKAFHHQHWEVFNSRKICEVTYARVQGLEALKEHFKNSKFACETDEYLPVVFAPPRDGRRVTPPLPIVLSTTTLSTTASFTVHHNHHDNDDVDGGDFTTSASTTPTTVPSSSDFDHHHHHHDDGDVDGGDHIVFNMEHDDDDDSSGGGSSNGGAGSCSSTSSS